MSRRARYDIHRLDRASTDSIRTYDPLLDQYRTIEQYVKMRLVAQNSGAA